MDFQVIDRHYSRTSFVCCQVLFSDIACAVASTNFAICALIPDEGFLIIAANLFLLNKLIHSIPSKPHYNAYLTLAIYCYYVPKR